MKKICFVSNTAWSFTRFRVDLLKALIAEGYEVLVLAPEDKHLQQLKLLGLTFIPLSHLSNQGANPYHDFLLYQEFKRIYREKKPHLVVQYTVKPNVYSTLAASRYGIPVIAVVTGLGYAFINKGVVSSVVRLLYRFAFRKANQVWFLNEDDRLLFLEKNLVEKHKTRRIPGEGINCQNTYNPQHLPYIERSYTSRTHFLFIGRLLYDKGIKEFVAAAKQIKQLYPNVEFQLLGYLNVANPAAVKKEELATWIDNGIIDYLGDTDDVRPYIVQADCVVLPSYREGMSTVLQESASLGKPIIATDIAGCRELVDEGVSGYLCKTKDVNSLVEQMVKFLNLTKDQQKLMGSHGRKKMISEFSVDKIIAIYKTEISSLIE